MTVTVRFCGAARTVTGSCYLLEVDGIRFLVDCGLFQGTKSLRELNYRVFPFDPKEIAFVLQTHAHIDHAGLLPKLFAQGFEGTIFATDGTRDLLSFMLPDSGHIQEMEVERLNRRRAREGQDPLDPIYTQVDAANCLEAFSTVDYEDWFEPAPSIRARFWNAGHVLGSASIEVEITRSGDQPVRLLFSGDIGPDNKLFHPDPHAPKDFDYVFCEATYGARERPPVDTESRRRVLADAVRDAVQPGRILLIPVFAVERTQELLTDLFALEAANEIAQVPIFLDSPLAARVTDVFHQHSDALEDLDSPVLPFENRFFRPTVSVEDSKSLSRITGGAIIMAASGMCDAGRIKHHLRQRLWDRGTTVLFVGYQAPGTLGALIAGGKKRVRIHGHDIKVAARIRQIDTYSGHADATELADWVMERTPIRRGLFLTHGEEDGIAGLTTSLARRGLSQDLIYAPALDTVARLDDPSGKPGLDVSEARLPIDEVSRWDWHNDLAEFTLDLREMLDAAADEKARARIIRRVKRALRDS